jgi:hypothetical protein
MPAVTWLSIAADKARTPVEPSRKCITFSAVTAVVESNQLKATRHVDAMTGRGAMPARMLSVETPAGDTGSSPAGCPRRLAQKLSGHGVERRAVRLDELPVLRYFPRENGQVHLA